MKNDNKLWKAFEFERCPAEIHGNVLAFHVAELAEPLPEFIDEAHQRGRRGRAKG